MTADLNPGQKEAVGTRAGRVVVSAGAGSGKTRVLVQRFVDRVIECERIGHASPLRSILLITFTDKAAGELTERVRTALLEADRPDLAREVDGAWISTIHAFCARIVRRHALELGVDVGFGVLTDPRGGIERSEAFERATRRSLDTPGVRDDIALFVEEGIAELRSSVLAGYDRARSRGVEPADVAAPIASAHGTAIDALARTFAELLPEYESLLSSDTSRANFASFDALNGAVSRVRSIADDRERADRTVALASHRGALTVGGRTKELTARINDALSTVVQGAVDAVAAHRANAWRTLLATFAEEYESAKVAKSVLDFEDLQLLTLRLWAERPDIAERVAAQFVEVMVDEFQDTNPLQMQVIEPISGAGQCVVGDVQQSIYRFRDADVGLLQGKRDRAEREGQGQACRLTVNYRSDARLLAGLNSVFGSEQFFGNDYLTLESGAAQASPWPSDAPVIEGLIVDKSRCPDKDWRQVEARALAARLRAVVGAGWADPGEIVVLLRASTTMPVYVSALKDAGFDVIAPSSGGFYTTPEYADIRALLRTLANPLDDEGMLGLLAGGLAGVSDDGLLALACARDGGGLWEVLVADAKGVLSTSDATRAGRVREVLQTLHGARGRLQLADAVLYAASVLGPAGGMLERAAASANVRKIARIAAEFEGSGAGDPAEFLHYLDDRETYVPRETAAGLATEGTGAVRVMTVHAAKGLEFPVVAVADLGHRPPNRHPAFVLVGDEHSMTAVSRGPERGRGDKTPRATAWQAAMDEEKVLDVAESKRVFYVACTRAQRGLILAGSIEAVGKRTEGSAADWVLDAAERAGADLAGTMAVRVLAAEDVPESADSIPDTDHSESEARAEIAVPRLPAAGPITPPREVSYTALALYDRCAYRFFAERMLRVGSLEVRGEQDPKAFGSTLHAALELVARGEVIDSERLGGLAASHGLPANSVERLVKAREAVGTSGLEPLLVRGRPEMPFAVAVEGGVVRGTMDLVVIDGDRATVLDYKTGLTWDATGARYSAQAEVYALALLEAGLAAVEVRFVHVEAGCEVVAYSFTAADRARIMAQVVGTLASMASGEFPSLKAYDYVLCADCPVSGGLCRVVHPHMRPKRSRQDDGGSSSGTASATR